jgi:hypothetical protein
MCERSGALCDRPGFSCAPPGTQCARGGSCCVIVRVQWRARWRSLRRESEPAAVLAGARCELPDRSGGVALPRVPGVPHTRARQPTGSASEVARRANGVHLGASELDLRAKDPRCTCERSGHALTRVVHRCEPPGTACTESGSVCGSRDTMCGVVRHYVWCRPPPYAGSSGTRCGVVWHQVRGRLAPGARSSGIRCTSAGARCTSAGIVCTSPGVRCGLARIGGELRATGASAKHEMVDPDTRSARAG